VSGQFGGYVEEDRPCWRRGDGGGRLSCENGADGALMTDIRYERCFGEAHLEL
jgi:hypothetical protein